MGHVTTTQWRSICLYATLRTTTSQPLLLLRLRAPRWLSAISINSVSQGTSNQCYSMLTDWISWSLATPWQKYGIHRVEGLPRHFHLKPPGYDPHTTPLGYRATWMSPRRILRIIFPGFWMNWRLAALSHWTLSSLESPLAAYPMGQLQDLRRYRVGTRILRMLLSSTKSCRLVWPSATRMSRQVRSIDLPIWLRLTLNYHRYIHLKAIQPLPQSVYWSKVGNTKKCYFSSQRYSSQNITAFESRH